MAAFLILPTYFKCGEALVREDPDSETKYLRLDAQWEILAHGYGRFEVLLALLAHEFPPQVRGPGHGTEEEEGGVFAWVESHLWGRTLIVLPSDLA